MRKNAGKLVELGLGDDGTAALRANVAQPKPKRKKAVLPQSDAPLRKSKRRREELESSTDDTEVDTSKPALETSSETRPHRPRWSKWLLTVFDDDTPLRLEELAGLRVPEKWLEDFEAFLRVDLALSESNAHKVLQQARARTANLSWCSKADRLVAHCSPHAIATNSSRRHDPGRCGSWPLARALPAANAQASFANLSPSRPPPTWSLSPCPLTNGCL